MSIKATKAAGLSTEQRAGHPSGKAWASSLKKGTMKPAIGKKKPIPTVVQAVYQPSHVSKQDLAGVQVVRHFGSLEDLVPAKTAQAAQPRLVGKTKPKTSAIVHFTPAPKPEQRRTSTPPVLQPVSLTLAPSNPFREWLYCGNGLLLRRGGTGFSHLDDGNRGWSRGSNARRRGGRRGSLFPSRLKCREPFRALREALRGERRAVRTELGRLRGC